LKEGKSRPKWFLHSRLAQDNKQRILILKKIKLNKEFKLNVFAPLFVTGVTRLKSPNKTVRIFKDLFE
jgi:hypothetical protein